MDDENIELSVRLTLHELLFELMLADQAAMNPGGKDRLAALGDNVVVLMTEQLSINRAMSVEQRAEVIVNARAITERFFADAERRRQTLVKLRR